jgi:hypothetical protein
VEVVVMRGVVVGTDLFVEQSAFSDSTGDLIQEGRPGSAAASLLERRLHEKPLAVHHEFMQIDGEALGVKAHAAGVTRAVDVRTRIARFGHSERTQVGSDLAEREGEPAVDNERLLLECVKAHAANRPFDDDRRRDAEHRLRAREPDTARCELGEACRATDDGRRSRSHLR